MYSYIFIAVAVSLLFGILVAVHLMNPLSQKKKETSTDALPYKIESAETTVKLAVPNKRAYVKRSLYWTDMRRKTVAKKASSKTKRKS